MDFPASAPASRTPRTVSRPNPSGSFLQRFISLCSLCALVCFAAPGRADTGLLWQDSNSGDVVEWYLQGAGTFLGEAGIASVVPLEWKIAGTPDIDGDGSPDILWQDSVTGDVVVWYMNGADFIGEDWIASAVPNEWKIVGTPDVNKDGHPDLLWQDTVTGGVVVWYMVGAVFEGEDSVASAVPTEWQIVGVE